MKRNLKTMFKGVFCVGALLACLSTARAQIEVKIGFPIAAFIATTQPVVFEGHAAYWYGGRWYYRDGNAWRYYRNEPPVLRDRRMRHEPERHFYGREHGGGYRDDHRDDHRDERRR
jgi:hypothetical protein